LAAISHGPRGVDATRIQLMGGRSGSRIRGRMRAMPDALRHATLRQLQIFLAAAAHSSFARAAEELHLTQPAVSMQMAQLAEVVGSALFERRGRKLALTQAGEVLVPYAERVGQTLREAGDALDALKGLRHGKLRIALVATTRYFAPRLLAQFRQEHPQIELDVGIAGREGLLPKGRGPGAPPERLRLRRGTSSPPSGSS